MFKNNGGQVMYQLFAEIGSFFSEPFMNLFYNTRTIPLLAALLLGLVGASAPCQFTGNIGAITHYGNRSLQKGFAWSEIFFFLLGKIIVFSGLGIVIWIFGREIENNFTLYFPWVRKLVGPMLVIMGIYLVGFIKFTKGIQIGRIPEKLIKRGRLGSFLLGFSLSLGFCPTMFILFFALLMPMALSVSYGAILPSIFAIGTSIPFLIVIFLIWYFELSGTLMKKGRKIGQIIKQSAGWVLIIVGILDTLTYWSF
jgi:cytochrome c-type biogenesis protein